jgi:hypothetical protein
MANTSAMTLIETKTLASAQASIEFTSIPQDGTDLFILASLRSSADTFLSIRFNGSTSNYTNRQLRGETPSVNSISRTDDYVGNTAPVSVTANTFGSHSTYIPNYAGSTNKSFSIDSVTENNATDAFQALTAGLWSDTSAITSVRFAIFGGGGNLVAGSTISLYKITKGSDGIVTTTP